MGQQAVWVGQIEQAVQQASVAQVDLASAYLGSSRGTAGDVNAGGYADPIAASHFNGQTEDGCACTYNDAASRPSAPAL